MERERVAGCLLGLMVGDSLGLPREGLSPRRAKAIFGGGLEHRFLFGRGLVSDDTEHACMTSQALLTQSSDADAFARTLGWKLRWWLVGLPAGVGLATLRSIVKLWFGFGPRSSGVRSAGNGPAMRSPVLGVFFARDPRRLRDFVSASTRITHTDPRAERGALAVARAAAYGATHGREDFSLDELWREIEASFETGDLEAGAWLAKCRQAIDAREQAPAVLAKLRMERGAGGYMYQTLPAVLWAWLADPFDFRGTLIRVVALGGDADTTAAIAGALCGATVGASGIPREWIDGIVDYPRSAEWVERLADALADAGSGHETKAPAMAWPLIPVRNVFFLAVVLAHGLRRLLPPY